MSTAGEKPTLAARRDAAGRVLAKNLRAAWPALKKLLAQCSGEWGYEDPVYRFYHQSYKVYALQEMTEEIVGALRALAPDQPLDERFVEIVADGTGKTFDSSHNDRWAQETRPIVEAFFHARYFLEMAVRYGRSRRSPDGLLASGWAALLELYGLR
jgi:hypothetical protein